MFHRVKLCAFAVLLLGAGSASAQNQQGLVERTLGVLSPADAVPQTAGERFHDYLIGCVGPLTLISEAASAGLGQWRDSPHEWGQGGAGYGKRFANNMAYNAVHGTVTYGVAELRREDNRYVPSGRGSLGARLLFAVESPAMARRNGRRTISVSSLAGIATAATVSLAWAPSSWQGADNAAINFGLTYAGIAGLNVAREFVPGIVRKLRR